MPSIWILILVAVVSPIAVVVFSFVFNSFRRQQDAPTKFSWASSLTMQYADVEGNRVRYLKTGNGSPIVLLHTLRTHLDLFQKILPELSKEFTVYALDYPGHGWSDIPRREYTPDFFVDVVSGLLQELEIKDAVVVGESIGGTIPLLMTAAGNSRVRAVVAVNPYDYQRRFTMRAVFITRFTFWIGAIPVLGETFMRLRIPLVERMIMQGGVANPKSLPAEFLQEMYTVGVRPGHYRGFISIIRHMFAWRQHHLYQRINVPVLLIYGDRDWSHEEDRQTTHTAIPGSHIETVRDAGHFLSMDQPDALVKHIRIFLSGIASDSHLTKERTRNAQITEFDA